MTFTVEKYFVRGTHQTKFAQTEWNNLLQTAFFKSSERVVTYPPMCKKDAAKEPSLRVVCEWLEFMLVIDYTLNAFPLIMSDPVFTLNANVPISLVITPFISLGARISVSSPLVPAIPSLTVAGSSDFANVLSYRDDNFNRHVWRRILFNKWMANVSDVRSLNTHLYPPFLPLNLSPLNLFPLWMFLLMLPLNVCLLVYMAVDRCLLLLSLLWAPFVGCFFLFIITSAVCDNCWYSVHVVLFPCVLLSSQSCFTFLVFFSVCITDYHLNIAGYPPDSY